MALFRTFLIVALVVLLVYTGVVMQNHGTDLFSVFFGDMAALTWAGQFNLDFMLMLMISGLWVAWRNQFSVSGMALGLLAFVGGAMFLTLYLLYLLSITKGDIKDLLVGDN
ncbi:MAG: hypothetical protein P8I38_11450 [Arenicella sp.]|jgi:hypothetical protein|nr:hypothetical protein [Arenicella sp.]HAU68477.1 hypothetical protein [Gammaproteobacteria bacterium]